MAAATTSKNEELLVDWLRDAHAMEKHAEQVLSNTASRIENYPELRTQIERHLQETRRQVDLVRRCLERHNGSTSTVKDTAGRVIGFAQAMSGLFAEDEIVKASMGSYVFEAMEIAAYRSLIVAAEACGDQETKRVCEVQRCRPRDPFAKVANRQKCRRTDWRPPAWQRRGARAP